MTTSDRRTTAGGLTRRQLISTAAAAGASALGTRAAPAADLPQRGEFVVRNAHVLTMDASRGDLARGDIHVRNGAIVAVGAELPAAGAQTIDGRGMIALPGLIETHNHLWNTTCRNIVMEGPQQGYFPMRSMRATCCKMMPRLPIEIANAVFYDVRFGLRFKVGRNSRPATDVEIDALARAAIVERLQTANWLIQRGPPTPLHTSTPNVHGPRKGD